MTVIAPGVQATLLDALLPTFDHRTTHGRAVAAPLAAVAEAIRMTSLDEARIARALMGVRTLGRSLRHQTGPIAETGDGEAGFLPLASVAHEVVVGFVGRPWPGGDRFEPLPDADAWRSFAPVDAVKVAMSLRCGEATYGTLLVTETRILCGDQARQAFDRYWTVIRPGAGLVRGSLLRAIVRHAERGT